MPAPTPTGALTASAEQCSVAAGETSCQITLTATTKDVTSAQVKDGAGNTYAVALNTAAELKIDLMPGEERSFSLSYGGTADTEAVMVEGVCASGVYLDNRGAAPVCAAVLRYENVVYGETNVAKNVIRFQGPSCDKVTVEMAVNATQYQENEVSLGDRRLFTEVLPSGRFLFNALVVSGENEGKAFVTNPLTNLTTEYDGKEGPAPAGTDPRWIKVSPSSEEEGTGKFAKTKDWMVYISRFENTVAYCRDNATGVVTTLKGLGPFQYQAFIAYRN